VKRRDFITLLGGAAAAWPLAARAQQTDKLPTIGLLGSTTPSAESQRIAAFMQRLRELGWIEDRNITIEYRWAEGRRERSASGTCFAGPHSPWSPPFAPPTPPQLHPPQTAPQQDAPLCSPASQLLWRSPTSHVRASSATAPRLPNADQVGTWPVVRRGTSQVPTRSLCA
jgi:hypothetical protein